MERKNHSIRRRNIVLGTVLAASFFGAARVSTEGKEPTKIEPLPDSAFKPVPTVIFEASPSSTIKPYSTDEVIPSFPSVTPKTPESPAPLSKEEIKKQKEKKELNRVLSKMKENPNLFKEKHLKTVEMYYPIYKAASDKYDIDWYLLFIVHEAETGASRGERGFAPDSYYKGAMQRDPNIWPESYVRNSARGLEYLKKLPQRHSTDWREIASAAHMLSDNFHLYKERGYTSLEAYKRALLRYSAEGPALNRFNTLRKEAKVFGVKN
jgi:hypothetical protein